jgi:molybdopterin-dependent oxidoreductase alpha subunit
MSESLPVLAPPASLAEGPLRGDHGVAGLVPFGLGRKKPGHFREMLGVVWENRDALPYALRILREGVCDGCSLGPRGLEDDVIPGVHLCMSRLKLLRNNTAPAFDEAVLADVAALSRLGNDGLRTLGRLPYPFVREADADRFHRVSWDEALARIGTRLQRVEPDRTAWFATSKGITNEAYYAFTKAARLFGTNNVDFCARLCHAATVSGLSRTIGVGAPTVSLSDLIGTDLVLLWGTNLANNQPVSVKYLAEAKRRGTRVVVVNTTREMGLDHYWVPSIPTSALFGSKIADDFVQVRVGGDIALMNAVCKLLIDWGAFDRAFIDAHTVGYAELETSLRATSMPDLLDAAGVSEAEARGLAETIARARTMVTVYSMGLTQHRHGTQNVMGVVNLHLLRGAIGKEKAGILPIRGHSGVQGGGECGVTPEKFPGGRAVNADTAAEMARLWGHPVPSGKGLSTGPMVEAAYDGRIDFFYSLGGNLQATMPDTAWAEQAMRRVAVRVHQDIHLNSAMLLPAGELTVLLPAQTRYEQKGGGTSTSTERRIRFTPEIPGHPQVGEAKPEWWIPGAVVAAARPELRGAFAWPDAADIRREISETMPIYAGIERLANAGDSVQWGGPLLCKDGVFDKMEGGRARFTCLDPPKTVIPPGRFLLTTRRGKQFNSMVFDAADKVQGGVSRGDVFVRREDADALSLRDGDAIVVRNERGAMAATLRLADIAERCVQAYWPEANVLIPRAWDPISEEPDYNAFVEIVGA